MCYVQGINRDQTLLLPEVIDEYVDDDNPVRFIDAYVDNLNLIELDFSYAETKETGRPPYNPGDMLKLYIYGYLNRVRSSRRLEKEAHRNLEVIWLLCKLRPDFKTIADFRKDNCESIKKVCHDFTLLCKKLNLFDRQLIAIDGSKFSAVNHNNNAYTQKKIKKLVDRIEKQVAQYLNDLEHLDECEKDSKRPSTQELKKHIESLKTRQSKLLNIKKQIETSGQSQVTTTDSDSRMMHTTKGNDVSYNVQIATDSKHKLIVDFEVTNDTNDQNQFSHMAIKAKNTLQVSQLEAVGDMGYYAATEVKKCVDENITCYIPKPRKSTSANSGLFGKDDFQYDPINDCYICPAKQKLPYRRQVVRRGKQTKVYESPVCQMCEIKNKCTRSKRSRLIRRYVIEDVMDEMHLRVAENPDKIKLRKQLVEHPFGTIKHSWNHSYFLTRGFKKVSGEMALSVLAYNMKRVMNIIGIKELLELLNKGPVYSTI